jgi:hypothetical protein
MCELEAAQAMNSGEAYKNESTEKFVHLALGDSAARFASAKRRGALYRNLRVSVYMPKVVYDAGGFAHAADEHR